MVKQENKKVISMIVTRNTWEAAAMLTTDEVELLDGVDPVLITTDVDTGEEVYTFRFKDTPMARRIHAAFKQEKEFVEKFPEEWIAVILKYRHNVLRLRDYIKQHPKKFIEKRDGKVTLTTLPHIPTQPTTGDKQDER